LLLPLGHVTNTPFFSRVVEAVTPAVTTIMQTAALPGPESDEAQDR
jgi:hypothetical protein